MNEKNTILYYTRLTFNNPTKLTGKSSVHQVLLDYIVRRELLTPHFYEDLSYITYPPLFQILFPFRRHLDVLCNKASGLLRSDT